VFVNLIDNPARDMGIYAEAAVFLEAKREGKALAADVPFGG
jgi:hypothetical protein